MIRLFDVTDKSYTTNGDIVLQPYKAVVRKEDNGDYYLDLELGIENAADITAGRIITANTPQGDQAFRVGNYEKTKSRVKLRANHVFYDAENYLIEDSYVVNKNCNDALDHLNNATEPTSPFTVLSDVGTVNSFRCVRKSLAEALKTVIERWGGHLVRDNWQIEVRASIGSDNGVVVRYAKNMKDISAEADWSDVVTKLLPVGKNGVLLPEVYVTSDKQYDIPFTRTVSFEQYDILEEDYQDQNGELDEAAYEQALIDDLRTQAQAYVDVNSYPRVNYTLSANLERITDVGDTVQVIDERLGISLMTNVIAFEFDCILEKYTLVEFGNFKQTLSGLMGEITATTEQIVAQQTDAVKVTLGEELQTATDKIMGVLGNSYVIYDGNQILVVDTLPKENANNVIRINAAGIGFSQTGINGVFNSAWTIDGTLDMQQINVINLTASLIKGGTLKLGSDNNASGLLELYDEENNLVGQMDKDGLKMFGTDGSYVLMNNTVGFAGYDRNDNQIYWVSADEFHMKKSVIEEEVIICSRVKIIPISVYSGGILINDGIGLVPWGSN
ncbi:MAG: phage tail protein [Lachnospiraceae bacterium]|nr:phage tail protein [Lachnospiraceae bacterium]